MSGSRGSPGKDSIAAVACSTVLAIGDYLKRARETARGLAHELRGGFALTADAASFARFASDPKRAQRITLPS